jgi:hypothetical protein
LRFVVIAQASKGSAPERGRHAIQPVVRAPTSPSPSVRLTKFLGDAPIRHGFDERLQALDRDQCPTHPRVRGIGHQFDQPLVQQRPQVTGQGRTVHIHGGSEVKTAMPPSFPSLRNVANSENWVSRRPVGVSSRSSERGHAPGQAAKAGAGASRDRAGAIRSVKRVHRTMIRAYARIVQIKRSRRTLPSRIPALLERPLCLIIARHRIRVLFRH